MLNPIMKWNLTFQEDISGKGQPFHLSFGATPLFQGGMVKDNQ